METATLPTTPEERSVFAFAPLAVQQYLDNEAPAIEGWLSTTSQMMFVVLSQAQHAAGLSGDLVEVGVWEGKTLLLFAHLATGDERAVGYDIEMRPRLIERSGRPDVVDRIQLHVCDTFAMTIDDFARRNGIRIFHVDGNHDKQHVMHDLHLACEATDARGVVVLDDFFSPTWPGVTAALFECFEQKRNSGFVPFALAGSKCWLARPPMVETYKKNCQERMPIAPISPGDQSLFGETLLIFS